MDIEYAFFAPTPSYVTKQRARESLIPNYRNLLLQCYHEYNVELINRTIIDQDGYNRRKAAFDNKVCFCGNNLRYISLYDFWGCSNYKNKLIEHITFSGLNPNIYQGSIRVTATWLPDIIQSAGLKGKVFAKELYEFYLSEGLEDLRIKYGYSTSENTFTGYIKAKARSIEQETLAEGYLLTEWPKVAIQQTIMYQLKGGKKSFCIPDFICGNRDRVLVVDAKLDYTNDPKMDKYVSLVEFIIRGKGDKRPVSASYVMYEGMEEVTRFFKSKYPIITIPPINDL